MEISETMIHRRLSAESGIDSWEFIYASSLGRPTSGEYLGCQYLQEINFSL